MSQHKFKISSALKNIIGRDLITDDFVAIFELVKNSIDANARNVKIIFDLDSEENAAIWIVDDGIGMDKQDLFGKWLFLAYSAKKEGVERAKRNHYAGYKGVGRFSCDRLGALLLIQSKVKGNKTVHSLSVDWGEFERNSKEEFGDIEVLYSKCQNFALPKGVKPVSSGVILKIDDVRDPASWDRKRLLRLRRALSKLTSPFDLNLKGATRIELLCESEKLNDYEFETKVNGYISNDILDVLCDKTTSLDVRITENGFLITELVDRGSLIYKTREDVKRTFSELLRAQFHLQMNFLNRSAKVTFSKRMGIPSIKYGSLFLLRNGFQVYPVGEETDDSWGLNRRKQQGHSRYLGTREILGFVSVEGDEASFRESSSRDKGLIRTSAAIQLDSCVRLCIKKLEAYVVGVLWRDKLDTEYETSERISIDQNRIHIISLIKALSDSDSIEVLEYNHDLIAILSEKENNADKVLDQLEFISKKHDDRQLQEDIRSVRKAVRLIKKEKADAIRIAAEEMLARRNIEDKKKETERQLLAVEKAKAEVEKERDEERRRSLFLASNATRDNETYENFIHQIIIYASNAKAKLKNTKKRPPETKDNWLKVVSDLQEQIEQILNTARLSIFADFRLDSGKICADVPRFISEFLNTVAKDFFGMSDLRYSMPKKEFVIEFSPVELSMIVENLISNAKKSGATSMDFDMSVKGLTLAIDVTDYGRGLDNSMNEPSQIFGKGFTKTRGSGLGLYICKKYLDAMGGDINIAQEQPPRGFRLTMRFRK